MENYLSMYLLFPDENSSRSKYVIWTIFNQPAAVLLIVVKVRLISFRCIFSHVCCCLTTWHMVLSYPYVTNTIVFIQNFIGWNMYIEPFALLKLLIYITRIYSNISLHDKTFPLSFIIGFVYKCPTAWVV